MTATVMNRISVIARTPSSENTDRLQKATHCRETTHFPTGKRGMINTAPAANKASWAASSPPP